MNEIKMEENVHCVVTGGQGFIGSHLVEECLSRGWHTTVIDDCSAPQNIEFYKFPGAEYVRRNVADSRCITHYEKAKYVFHLAARSRIQPSIHGDRRETFRNNVMGTLSVLEAAKEHGCKVVYASSSSVYGLRNDPPLNEDMQTDCLNPYSLSKKHGEELCALYWKLWSVQSACLRLFNVYGPREPLKGQYAPVVGMFKRQHQIGEALTIVGDGEQRRDFTYVKDAVRAFITVACSSISDGRVYNVGTGRNYSINEIASFFDAKTVNVPVRPAEARVTLADVSKIARELSFVAATDLQHVVNAY